MQVTRKLGFLNILLNIILRKYFVSRCSYIISDPSGHFIVDKVNYNEQTIRAILEKGSDRISIIQDYSCEGIIIIVENPASILQKVENLIRRSQIRHNNRRYIIVNLNDSIEKETDVFKLNELQYLEDLLIIRQGGIVNDELPGRNGFYTLSTQMYSSSKKVIEGTTLDYWFAHNESFLYGVDLYPDKVSNLQQRQLKLVSIQYEPFSVYDPTKQVFVDGVETRLCLEYAKKHNASVGHVFAEGYWGEIYENWTGYGILGTMAEDMGDISFGALYRWADPYSYLDFSVFITRSGVRLYVPAPKLISSWILQTYTFSTEVWICALSLFFFCSVLLWITSLYRGHQTSKRRNTSRIKDSLTLYVDKLFTTTRIFLEQSVNWSREEKVFKLFAFFVMIQTLLLSFFYNSGLASIMTIPRYEPPIKTIQDFADVSLKWGASSDIWIQAFQSSEDEKYRKVVNKYVVTNDEELIRLGRQQALGYPLERLLYGHFALAKYHTRDMVLNYRVTYEDLNWDFCVFMLRKSSIYLPSLDNLVMRIYESGIVAHWENEVVYKYMDSEMQNLMNYFYINHEVDYDVTKLAWAHVKGAFGILVIGNICSTLCFVIEVISVKKC